MANEFLMPKLGLTMEEGTILQWLVDEGADVAPGMPVMLIETDKVESEVEASSSGRLHRIGAEGDTFTCGAVVGLLLGADEQPPTVAAAAAPTPAAVTPAASAPATLDSALAADAGSSGSRRFISPNARRLAAERNIDLASVRGSGPAGRVVSEDLDDPSRRVVVAAPARATSSAAWATPAPSVPMDGQSSVPATAAARQLADLLGVDLRVVPADPLDGYVTRECVARYVRGRLQQSSAPAASEAPASGAPAAPLPAALQTPTQVRRMSGVRGTIAKRMHASLQEMAQLTLMMDAEMDSVVADRNARRADGTAPAYTDYVIAAVARALREHPRVNSQVTADGIAELPEIHVGLAVALDEGLLVPVVRNADQLSLDEIATTTSRLAKAARAGSLALADLEGGTFSVSALGMFGVDGFTPVVNPPNAAILGVGRVREDVVLVDGQAAARKRLTLSLTWDHRVFDGAPAAAFCAAIVRHLSDAAGLA